MHPLTRVAVLSTNNHKGRSSGSSALAPHYVSSPSSCTSLQPTFLTTLPSQVISFLPETLRSIVGDGSIKGPAFYTPLLPIIGRSHPPSILPKPPSQPFKNPLRLFLMPDVALLLFFNAIPYSVFYGVTASISTLFADAYPFLNETDLGLCYLAIGGGMLLGSYMNGMILDREYQTIKRQLERRAREDAEKDGQKVNVEEQEEEDVTKEETFPIEYARFRLMPVYFGVFVAVCAGYGWCLQFKVNMAGPLILQVVRECSSCTLFFPKHGY